MKQPDVLSATLGLLLLIAAATLGAAAVGLPTLGITAVALASAGTALLAWAYLP